MPRAKKTVKKEGTVENEVRVFESHNDYDPA